MNITISQPRFLPHISYIARIAHADVFVVLDDVQHNSKFVENRNRYLDIHTGESRWITMPLDRTETSKPILCEAKFSDMDKIKNHIVTLSSNLKRCKYYDHDFLVKVLDIKTKNFEDYCLNQLELIMEYIEIIMPKIVYSKNMETFGTSKQNKLELILKNFDEENLFFITGKGSMSYLKDLPFSFGYNCNTYEYESYNGKVVPYLNILDTIFNIGKEETRKMIMEVMYSNE